LGVKDSRQGRKGAWGEKSEGMAQVPIGTFFNGKMGGEGKISRSRSPHGPDRKTNKKPSPSFARSQRPGQFRAE